MDKRKDIMRKKQKIEGVFRGNEKGFGFVELENEELEDIFIPSKYTNGALNGDKVELIIFKPKSRDKRAEGKIVKILK